MTFEVIKLDDGTYRWRLRDETGEIVSVQPGKIGLPPGSAAAMRRSRAAVQKVLARRYEAQMSGS